MNSFGIYLYYTPGAKIGAEGLGRFLSFILAGMFKRQEKVIIACPKWILPELNKLLNDFPNEKHLVEIITTKKIPLAVYFRELHLKRHNKNTIGNRIKSKTQPFKNFLQKKVLRILINLLTSNNFLLFFLGLALTAISIVLLFPILLFSLIIWAFQEARRNIPWILEKLNRLFPVAIDKFNRLAIGKKIKSKLRNTFTFKFRSFSYAIYDNLRKKEIAKLNALVNKRKDIQSWLVTNLFCPEIKDVKAQKIVLAPDLVYLDFPVAFINTNLKWMYKCYEDSVKMADKLICFSRYVKENHLIQGCNVSHSKISVIPHGWIDLSSYLNSKDDTSQNVAKKVLREWLERNAGNLPNWLIDFDLMHTDFFFYSSQARPYKNLFNLVKAYEFLLRRKYINCKLILTCSIYDGELANYIINKRLNFEIIHLIQVPQQVLAALNKLSVCAVNPSYFEGGFPFTFSEAYSVGTPSVMANIPVTQEIVTDKKIADFMLFDPTDYKDMAEKMAWAFKNKDQLFTLQKPIADKLVKRTWEMVANDYINLLM